MPDQSDLHIPKYSAAHVCAAAQITDETRKNWGTRKPAIIPPEDDDRENAGKGKAIRYSRRRVFQIVAVAKLVRMGIPVSRAASIALAFSDFGEATQAGIVREPGGLYAGNQNHLVSFGDRDVGFVIDQLTPDRLLWAATNMGAKVEDGFVAVPLNALVARVSVVLDAAVAPAHREAE